MKNFKKLLVTLLALALLVCGAVVVSLAANTPAEVIAEARVLLDQAMQEDGYIALRSQKMRELDALIESNKVIINGTQEWLDFRVEYETARIQLREDCVDAATEQLDNLMDQDLSAKDAQELYAGLILLVSGTGDYRGYFDTDSGEYAALQVRMRVAQVIAKLQEAEDSPLAMDKGVALLWVNGYKSEILDQDEDAMATAEYALIDGWFAQIYDSVRDDLYEAVRSKTEEAMLATTSYDRAMALAAEVQSYITDCYFDESEIEYSALLTLSYYAEAYAYLNEIDRSPLLLRQGAMLKALAQYAGNTALDDGSERYRAFSERFEALRNFEDPDSVVSLLYAKADEYKKQIADVFVEGYNGALDSEVALDEVYSALSTLVSTCYFPDIAYANDVVIAETYVGIFNFYTAFEAVEPTLEDKIERNKLYKSAVALYNLNSSSIAFGSMDYSMAFVNLYTSLITEANKEVNAILNDLWLKPANECTVRDESEAYVYSLAQIIAAHESLNTYYISKATALYYGATEDKAKTAEVQTAMNRVELRILKDITETLTAIAEMMELPEELANVDPVKLQQRIDIEKALFDDVVGFTFIYAEADSLKLPYHKLYVSMMVSKLCEVELELAKEDADPAVLSGKYEALKTFMQETSAEILVEEEDYIFFLDLKNKTDVKIGEAYVPGARELLAELEAIVDEDSFDKVYALMRLDEFIRQKGITRPADPNSVSASADFFRDYDVSANKVKEFRAAKAAEREAKVSLSEYSGSYSLFDMDKSTPTAGGEQKMHRLDTRHYGVDGAYLTFEYLGNNKDGYVSVSPASSTKNFILEMYITTFDQWPAGGVSINSAYRTGLPSAIWPWLGAITGSGQLQVPNGSGEKKIVTDREGGYIIPGQWTHLIMVYNAEEKTVGYYINDERIKDDEGNDTWSCALSKHFDLNEPLRIGHSQGTNKGSFSLDNVSTYIGDNPRNVTLLNDMTELELFRFYTGIAENYVDNNVGKVEDAKIAVDWLNERIGRYWGVPSTGDDSGSGNGDGGLGDGSGGSGDGSDPDAGAGDGGGDGAGTPITPAVATYLFDETTYWNTEASNYVDQRVSYAELCAIVDRCVATLNKAGTKLESALRNSVLAKLREDIEKLESLVGISNLSARKTLIASIDSYIVENESYISAFEGAMLTEYQSLMKRRDIVSATIDSYARVDEYIKMVNKFAAARDLYSRTIFKTQAKGLMDIMERDDALDIINLEALKADIPEFVQAIEQYEELSRALDDAMLQDNNDIIVDCMSRFPESPEQAIKEYDRLNKYIVLVRRILYEGSYDPEDLAVIQAILIYNKMNDVFYDALQEEHAGKVQALIDTFNAETSYITRLGIFKAVQAYLSENETTIDTEHEAIKTILSQYEEMEERFGTEEGREKEWEEYGETLKINAGKFATIVTEMRLCTSYEELGALRERAAVLFYYMDSSDAEAALAVEYYLACEQLLAQKALYGDIFIDAAYALGKVSTMQDIYAALLVAKDAFANVDTTYDGKLYFTEKLEDMTYTVEYTMEEAIGQYQALLASYNSFVTVINAEVNTALDVVCSVRASFAVNQPVVALFKKIYD